MSKVIKFESPHSKIKEALSNKPGLLNFYNSLLYRDECKPFLKKFKESNDLTNQDIINIFEFIKANDEGKNQIHINGEISINDLALCFAKIKEMKNEKKDNLHNLRSD
ncbi:hypothetical protein [Orenia marismortui]|uniref:hypothetical protein n=1 Tax=Orenia marismortui TaxID=46469 RepID=UPI00036E96B9|nr:hypothetical protein [Orenia marismortui]